MNLEILTPESLIFSGTIESVTVPGKSGEFQVLPNHAPMISALKNGDVKIKIKSQPIHQSELLSEDSSQKSTLVFKVSGGVLEVMTNRVVLLAEV